MPVTCIGRDTGCTRGEAGCAAGMAEAAERVACLAAAFTREGLLEEAAAASDSAHAEACRAAATEVLTAGMPLAALPVESLYRQWSASSAEMAAARGLYLGDSAHHIMAVYEACGIEVPSAFSAMPDHLALMAELVAMLAAAGNADAARQVAADHFAWLGDYDAALAKRAEACAQRAEARAAGGGGAQADPLCRGIGLLRGRLAEIDRLIRESIG